MKYTVTNNYRDADMTSLVGEINTTYEKLYKTFGKPLPGGDKTNSEWIIKFADGQVATIYDWKMPETPTYEYDWHIGGNKEIVVDRLRKILA